MKFTRKTNTSKHNQQLANLEGDLSLQHLRFAGVLVPIPLVLPKLKLIVQPEKSLRIGFKSIEISNKTINNS